MNPVELRKLLEALKGIDNRLSGIEKRLCSKAENNKAESAKSSPLAEPLQILARISSPISVSEYRDPDKKSVWISSHKNGLKTTLEIIGIIVAAILAGLNWGVLNQIKIQTPNVVDSAKAAQDSANLLRQQLAGLEAAKLEIVADLSNSGVLISISNLGRVYAKDVAVHVDIARLKLPDLKMMGEEEHCNFTPARMEPSTDSQWCPYNGFLNIDIYNAMMHTKQTVRVSGTIRYNDGFDSIIDRAFCAEWIGYSLLVSNGPYGGINNSSHFVPCSSFVGELAMASRLRKAATKDYYEDNSQGHGMSDRQVIFR